jgi:serine/threonine-protein kinase
MPNGIFDYAIMQFYKDGNLSSFIKSNPTLAQKEQAALDLLEGIHHLHKHSVVHRDLKPGNILIVKRGAKIIPVITDFGLSKNAKMEGQSRFSNSFGGGTLKYSSPEQLKAERLRLNTDLWAYGVIVYEIFTGKNLFMAQQITGASAEAEKEIYEQIIGVDVSEMIKELPSKWQEVVKQCLVRDGAKRIKSTQALKDLILKGESSPKEKEPFIEDKTIISEVVSEESMNAQTIVNDKQTTEKEAVKKEPIQQKEQPPIKKENKKTASFSEYNKEFKKKKVVPFLKGCCANKSVLKPIFSATAKASSVVPVFEHSSLNL